MARGAAQWERAECRKHVGLFQYVANDRFDLKYAVKEVRRDGQQWSAAEW